MSKPEKRQKQEKEEPERTGPRGGTSTMTRSGMVKKNFWLRIEDADALRKRAFEERRTEAEIIREGLKPMLRDWMGIVVLVVLVG